MIGGINLGTIYAAVKLDLAQLKTGMASAGGLLKGFDRTVSSSATGVNKSLSGIGNAFGGLKVIGVAAAGAAAAAIINMAADYDYAMREVNTLSRLGEEAFQNLKDSVLDLSSTMEHGATEMAQGMYWVTSALPDASDADRMKVLEASSKLATAGLSDMEDASDLLTTALNAWGMSTEDVTHASDVLLKIVERGKTKIPELAGNFSKAASSAAMMGVPIDDLGAVLATLTRAGIPADRALMGLNRTLLGLNKPTQETANWINQLGYENAQAMLATEGLEGFLTKLHNSFGDNTEAITKMFPNIRELLVLLPSIGKNFGDIVADMDSFASVAGTTDEMFEQMADTAQYRWSVAMNDLKATFIELGEGALPGLNSAIDGVAIVFGILGEAVQIVNGSFEMFGDIMGAIKFGVDKLQGALGGLGDTLGGVGGGITGLLGKFSNITSVLSGAGIWDAAKSLISVFTESSEAADRYKDSLDGIKEFYDKQIDGASSLAGEVAKLRDEREGLVGIELEANLERENELLLEMGSILPGFIQGWDDLGQTWAYDKDMLSELTIASGKYMEGTGSVIGQLDSLHQANAQIQEDAVRYTAAQEFMLKNLSLVTGDMDEARAVMAIFEQDGAKGWSLISDLLVGAGENTTDFGIAIMDAANAMAALQTEYGGGLDAMAQNMAANESAWRSWVASMRTSMTELAGQGPAAIMSDEIYQVLSLFASTEPQMQQAGVELIAAFIDGLSGEVGPEQAGDIAQQLFNTGTFTATGIEAVDSALSAMEGRLGQARLEEAGRKAAEGVKKSFDALFGRDETQEVNIEVSDGGTSKKTVDELDEVEQKAEDLGNLDPEVSVRGDTAQPNAALSRLLNRLKDIDGRTLATINVKAQIVGSGPFTAVEYVRYLEDTISQASPSFTVDAQFGGGGIDVNADDLTRQWDSLTGAFGNLYQVMEERPFREIEEAIMAITGGSGAHLEAWRNIQDTYKSAKEELDKLSDAIDKHQKKINQLSHEQELLNRKLKEYQDGLQEANESLQYWQDVSIRGETAADDKSFKLQQKISKLQLGILKAEQEYDYEKAAKLTLRKEELENQKKIHDLETDVKYDPKRRELEKMLDPMHGVEASYRRIREGITDAQNRQRYYNKRIDQTQDKIDAVTRKINKNRDAVFNLKIEFDNARVHVDAFQQKIDQMADHFVTRVREMREDWDEYMKGVHESMFATAGGGAPGGGYVGSYQHGGVVPATGWAYVHAGETIIPSTVNMTQVDVAVGDSTVNVPVYLDSRKIAHATTRITGRNADVYHRSGGVY